MTRYFAALTLGLTASLYSGTAMAESWVQIEAQPSLTAATNAARGYAARLPNVVGFTQAGRWHAIATGPYATEAQADEARRAMRAQGLIPNDSFVSDGGTFRQAFWPVGGIQTAPLAPSLPIEQSAADTQPVVSAAPEESDETLSQARTSERNLNRLAREELQIALKFSGHYTSTIDGSFGRGTRGAMAAWQEDNGFEATGVLTTKQRALALKTYSDFVASLGLTEVADEVAGLTLTLPLGLVEFDSYSPPFAKYKAKDGSGVEVLLISQTGDEATLGGLFEIMQTLDIVPLEGPRSRKKSSFSLVGESAQFVSHTEAKLTGGHVKGFTLIWPTGDEQRRQMALAAMQGWTSTSAVLPDAYGDGAAQDIDLLAGLNIRRADKAGSGMFVDDKGHVLTSEALIEGCSSLVLDDSYDATVVRRSNGLALLAPTQQLSPTYYAAFDSRLPRLQSEISVSGYAYEGRLGAASLNYGLMAEHVGLNGEPDILRLELASLPGEAGGPVLASSGGVIGMLAPQASGTRVLPENVSFAYDMEKLVGFLSEAGVAVTADASDADLSDAALTTKGRNITALVSCWM